MTRRRKSIRYNPGKEDRMSNLPDETILHILSFMGAKDAVRSGLWSKRFASLWTNVASLYFQLFHVQRICSILRKFSNLEKISVVNCYGRPDFRAEFGELIRLLSSYNVKEFSLEFQEIYYKLPQQFYLNSSLKKLTLDSCKVETHVPVSWKSLQSLSFSEIELTDTTINNVLSGCPCLESLKFNCCSKFNRIDMSKNKCLRKLVVAYYDQAGTLEIIAPHLQSLILDGGMKWSKCKVLDAKSITYCCLSFYNIDHLTNENDAITMVTSLFEDLSDVEVVTIEEWVLQRLSLMEQQGLQCPMSETISSLKVRSSWTTDDMVGKVGMLRHLSRLEKLATEFWDFERMSWFRKDDKTLKKLSYWTAENTVLNLKTLKIEFFSEDDEIPYSQTAMFLLVKFVLKSAKFMEKMTVVCYGTNEYLVGMRNELQGLPRSSPHALVNIVKRWDCKL